MKTTTKFFAVMAIALLLFSPTLLAQDTAAERPAYVTATTMHWNMDNENFNWEEWIATEKEYSDKVTKKNENIMTASFFMHRYTADNTELVYVQTYPSWEAIDKAVSRNDELAKEAWPDETARKAFLDKQAEYYDDFHSDEIYATLSGAKVLAAPPGDDMILYVRKSNLAYPDDGSAEDFEALRTEFTENVIHKNELVQAYYPNVHAWGSNRTEFLEAFMVNSMADLDAMSDKDGELVKAHWPDEAARKAMNEKMNKYFTGVHGDYIYTLIEELSK